MRHEPKMQPDGPTTGRPDRWMIISLCRRLKTWHKYIKHIYNRTSMKTYQVAFLTSNMQRLVSVHIILGFHDWTIDSSDAVFVNLICSKLIVSSVRVLSALSICRGRKSDIARFIETTRPTRDNKPMIF